jgi:hypothetical protein
MNSNGRAPGIIETKPRAASLPLPRHTEIVLKERETAEKWLIFEHTVYCIGEMYASDYQKFVQSHATSEYLAHILLDNIGIWDLTARWYTALELLKRGKIRLYGSREEAERAREVAA